MKGAAGRSWRALSFAVCAGLLLTLVSGAARAEDEAAGRKHFKQGQDLYTAGKYLDAAKEFEAGYQAAPRPLFLLNIGHSYRRAQELRKAKDAYQMLLTVDPTTPHRPEVEDLIRTIDDALNAPVSSSDSFRSPPPVNAGVPASPPRTAPLPAAPPVVFETTPPPPPATESSSVWKSPWLWGAVGLVIAAGVAGTVYGLSRGPSCQVSACYMETKGGAL